VGYSPYYTTAIWFGFDKPGNSLGVELTGSTLAGPVWGDYMREIHQGLPRRDFSRPATGIIHVTVCAKSGLLKTPACAEGDVTLPFLDGTQPGQYCNIHGTASSYPTRTPISSMPMSGVDEDSLLGSLTMPRLPPDMFPELQENQGRQPAGQNTRNTNSRGGASANRNSGNLNQNPLLWSFNNTSPPPENSPESGGQVPVPGEAWIPEGQEAAGASAGLNEAMPAEPATDGQGGAVPVTHNDGPENGLELPSYNPLLD
jgi:penicillin-binding protein 1A